MEKIQEYRRAITAHFATQEKERFDAMLTGPQDASWLRRVWGAYKR